MAGPTVSCRLAPGSDQVRGRNRGRADLDQVVEVRVAGGGIGEHQLDKADDDGEVVAQKV